MSTQLELPLGDTPARLSGPANAARRVFVCRDLKMARCDWIGFDMDYTLAIYNQEAMDRVSIEATVSRLIARGYPELIQQIPYPLDFPIRGLLIDKRLGNVLR